MHSLLEPVSEVDSQQFCKQIMKRLDIQRRNDHLCNVILEVGSDEDQARLQAHRNVLCAASPFFYNALNTEMKEKEEGVIRLEDTSKVLMEQVLEFFYTGHVDISDNNAFELMAVADYFLVTSLKLLSSKFIQDTLCVSNCIMAYYSSVKYHCSKLQEAARSFIHANFMAVTKTDHFLNLSVEQVEEWISSDDIVVKGEEDVFMAILIWTENNYSERKQSFFDLFRHIRCQHVPHNFLVTVILQHELVRGQKECLDLVLDAMKELSDGSGAYVLKQSPRKGLDITEDAVFAFGGENGNDVMCYLPTQDRWHKMQGPEQRRYPQCLTTCACQGKLYIIGGNCSSFDSTVECFDPLLKTWSSSITSQRVNFATAVTFQGFLYVVGGMDSSERRLSTVKRYNPDTNLWQEVSPLSSARSSVCVVADENFIYAIGGSITPSSGNCCTDITEKFDPKFNSWSRIAPTQAKRRGAAGVSLHRNIFVFGGVDRSGGCPCELYNKDTNVWAEITNDIAPKCRASAVSVKGQIFVLGGFGVNQSDSQEQELKVYKVEKNEWKPCCNAFLGSKLYKLSAGKILKKV